jgi:transcriptional regulator with XRE-family HTH domain
MSGTPATPAMEYLGQLCFVQRKALRMTLEEVAALAGTSKSYLWEIEHGQSQPSFMLVATLCEALELDISGVARSALRVARRVEGEAPVEPLPANPALHSTL